MNYLQQIEQYIIDGKPEQFILNCLQAVEAKFFEAIERNLPHIVKFMIEHGADVYSKNKLNYSPLDLASYNGHLEVIKLLVRHGVSINSNDYRCLNYAIHKKYFEVAKFAIESGCRPPRKTIMTMIMYCKNSKGICQPSYGEIAEMLEKLL